MLAGSFYVCVVVLAFAGSVFAQPHITEGTLSLSLSSSSSAPSSSATTEITPPPETTNPKLPATRTPSEWQSCAPGSYNLLTLQNNDDGSASINVVYSKNAFFSDVSYFPNVVSIPQSIAQYTSHSYVDALAYCPSIGLAYFAVNNGQYAPQLYSANIIDGTVTLVGILKASSAFGATCSVNSGGQSSYVYAAPSGHIHYVYLSAAGDSIALESVLDEPTIPVKPFGGHFPAKGEMLAVLGRGDIDFDSAGNLLASSTTIGPDRLSYSRQLVYLTLKDPESAAANILIGGPYTHHAAAVSTQHLGQIVVTPDGELLSISLQGIYQIVHTDNGYSVSDTSLFKGLPAIDVAAYPCS